MISEQPRRENKVMKSLLAIFIILIAASCAGCASAGEYFQNRALDFADCFRADVGYGIGLDARVRFTDAFSLGVGASYTHKFGFIGRFVSAFDEEHLGIPATNIAVILGYGPCGGGINGLEGCCFCAAFWQNLVRTYTPESPSRNVQDEIGYGTYIFFPVGGLKILPGKMKSVEMHSDALSYFDIEAGGTAGFIGASFGFSPGEFVDFLLGWFGLDIGEDDKKPDMTRGDKSPEK